MKKLGLLISLLMIASMLGACATPTPEVIEKVVTKEVEKVVTQVIKETVKETVIVEGTPQVVEKEVTKIVEQVVTATPVPSEPVFLRYADKAGDLGTMDPHFAAATQDRNLVDMLYNALVRYKPGDGSVFEADLAEALPEPELVDGKQV